jgi:hypothetical protein
MNNATIPAEKVVILNIRWNSIGKQKSIKTRSQADGLQAAEEADRLRHVKKLFDCPELDAIATHDGITRRWITRRAYDGIVADGFYLLPIALTEEVEKYLQAARDQRAELVEKFAAVYAQELDRARALFADFFNPSDYPADPRERFSLTWRYLSLAVPDTLPAELRQAELNKAREAWNSAAQDVRDALRDGFRQVLDNLRERLTPDADGKKKIFRDSTVENFVEFLDLFERRNITDDSALTELIRQARNIISNTNADTLRKSRTQAQTVAQKFAAISAELSGLITTKSSRKITLDD